MCIAETGDGVTAVKVEYAPAVSGDDLAALRALREERQLAVYGNRGRGLPCLYLAEAALHYVHAAAGVRSPLVSGSDQRRFIHCTAPPAAPFMRLSIAHMTTTESSTASMPMWQ